MFHLAVMGPRGARTRALSTTTANAMMVVPAILPASAIWARIAMTVERDRESVIHAPLARAAIWAMVSIASWRLMARAPRQTINTTAGTRMEAFGLLRATR